MNVNLKHPLTLPTPVPSYNTLSGQYPVAMATSHVLGPILWSRFVQSGEDQITPGVFRGEDEIPAGTWHGEDSLPVGTFH